MSQESVGMEFEIEDSFRIKIDQIIAKDLQELFGDDGESSARVQRHSSISPSKPEVKTALPLPLYEIMINMPDIAVDNPYNRLITAIEMFEHGDKEDTAIEVLKHGDKQEIICSTENISQQEP
jgi:hypothetical protein